MIFPAGTLKFFCLTIGVAKPPLRVNCPFCAFLFVQTVSYNLIWAFRNGPFSSVPSLGINWNLGVQWSRRCYHIMKKDSSSSCRRETAGEEGVKFGILLHSHEHTVSLSLGAGAIFIYMAFTIMMSEQLLTTYGFLLRALQRGIISKRWGLKHERG